MWSSREWLSNDKVLDLGDFQCSIISLLLKIYNYFYSKQVYLNLNYYIAIINHGKFIFYNHYAINYEAHFSAPVRCVSFLRCTNGHMPVSAVARRMQQQQGLCCISFNLQVVVGESLNRSIIIAICEDLILLYSSDFMDYIVYCYDLHCI